MEMDTKPECRELDELLTALRTTFRYTTPAGFAPRRPCCAGLQFKRRLLTIYCHAAREAKRGGAFTPRQWAYFSCQVMRAAEKSGARVHVSGLEHVAGVGGPRVVIGNHMSVLETNVLPCLLLGFGEVAFVIKESLRDYPLFGHIMRAVKAITVTRRNPRADLMQVLQQGTDLLRQGVSVIIFPQATRSDFFIPTEFNTLGIKLAARAGVPAVPLALKTDFFGVGRIWKDMGPINPDKEVFFQFGPPVKVTGHGRAEHAKVLEFQRATLSGWGVEVREGKNGEHDS